MKKLLLTLALVFASTAVFAADKNTESEKSYGPYVTNGFWDNWYINLGAGVNTWGRLDIQSNPATPYHYHNKVRWMIEGSVGKWITPLFGARLHGQGTYFLSSYTNEVGAFYNTNVPQSKWGDYTSKFGYGFIDVDGMVNLSNWIGGYKANRVYSAVGIAGVGVAWSRGRDEEANNTWSTNAEFAMSLGLNNVFRVCEQVDINVELKTMMVRQEFAGEGTVGMVGLIPSVSAGVTYKFKQRNFTTASAFAAAAVAAAAAEVAPYQDRIKDLENELANANDRADKLAGDLADANKDLEECQKASKRPKGYGPNGANLESGVSFTVFFPINKANITKKDMVNLGYVADEINANPGQKYTVCGYADKQTGTAAYNMTLSQKRADNVKKVLVEKFGCNADQIEAVGYGDTVDKYGAQILNRAAYVN